MIHRPVQIESHSRVDTWRRDDEKPISTVRKLVHRPMYVQARSKIDTWSSETRSKTVPTRQIVSYF